jgi:FlaA1/EpsC-like NDP-sugar epimerase
MMIFLLLVLLAQTRRRIHSFIHFTNLSAMMIFLLLVLLAQTKRRCIHSFHRQHDDDLIAVGIAGADEAVHAFIHSFHRPQHDDLFTVGIAGEDKVERS